MARLPLAADSTFPSPHSALSLAAIRRRRAKPLISFPSLTLPFAYFLFTQPYPAARGFRAFLPIELVGCVRPPAGVLRRSTSSLPREAGR